MKRCDNCRFWVKPDDKRAADLFDKVCTKVEMVMMTYTPYKMQFPTPSDFSCKYHEEKVEEWEVAFKADYLCKFPKSYKAGWEARGEHDSRRDIR